MADFLLMRNLIILLQGLIAGTAGIICMAMPYSSYDYYSIIRHTIVIGGGGISITITKQFDRYHADNVTILSFDKTGKLEWSNVIHKEQFDDEW